MTDAMEVDIESAAVNGNGTGLELTEAESELYDRQIRLWGLEAQKKLRTARVLISGLCGIGAEVTKNIILSGVNSVKLQDDKAVTEEDFCSQFLVPRTALGSNRAEASIERARALNPMVEISSDTEPLSAKNADFFGQFDVVVVCGAPNSELVHIDNICRELKVKFLAGNVWGTFGFCFADLQEHSYFEDVYKHKIISKPHEKEKTEIVTTTVQRSLTFPPYSAVVDFDINAPHFQRKLKRTGPSFILLRVLQTFRDTYGRGPSYTTREEDIVNLKKIRDEISNEAVLGDAYFELLMAQISPAAAVVGGVLSQEIIKVVTKKEKPHCNVYLFDPELCCGYIENIGVN